MIHVPNLLDRFHKKLVKVISWTKSISGYEAQDSTRLIWKGKVI